MAKKLTVTADMMKELNERIAEKQKKGELMKSSELYAMNRESKKKE